MAPPVSGPETTVGCLPKRKLVFVAGNHSCRLSFHPLSTGLTSFNLEWVMFVTFQLQVPGVFVSYRVYDSGPVISMSRCWGPVWVFCGMGL